MLVSRLLAVPIAFVLLLLPALSSAQLDSLFNFNDSTHFECGTEHDSTFYDKFPDPVGAGGEAKGFAPPPCTCVNDPVCRDTYIANPGSQWMDVHLLLHVYRNDNGEAGPSNVDITNMMNKVNADFAPGKIRFCYTVDWIDSTEIYRSGPNYGLPVNIPNNQTDMCSVYIEANGETQGTYVSYVGLGPLGGPAWVRSDHGHANSMTLTHELGHVMSLDHTFNNDGGPYAPSRRFGRCQSGTANQGLFYRQGTGYDCNDNSPAHLNQFFYPTLPGNTFGGTSPSCSATDDYAGNPNANFVKDRIADTDHWWEQSNCAIAPPQPEPAAGYWFDCGGTDMGLAIQNNTHSMMMENFMQYGQYTCKNPSNNGFTPQQFARMRCYVTNYQPGWLAFATGCTQVGAADFKAYPQTNCTGGPIQFTDWSTDTPTGWFWEFGDGNTSTLQNPVHSYATPGKYKVKLTPSYGGLQGTPYEKKGFIFIQSAGHAVGHIEQFEATHFPPQEWFTVNPDRDGIAWQAESRQQYYPFFRAVGHGGNANNHPWKFLDVIGSTGAPTKAAFAHGGDPLFANKDYLYSPAYDLRTCADLPELVFDLAYVPVGDPITNATHCNLDWPGVPVAAGTGGGNLLNLLTQYYHRRLEVEVTTDCGLTWTNVYNETDDALRTTSDCAAFQFTPTDANNWRQETIDISSFAGPSADNVRFRFIISGDRYANPLWLDNIGVIDQSRAVVVNSIVPDHCGNLGSIDISGTSVHTPLQYSIDNGTTWQATGVFGNLPGGAYDFLVRDALGCITPIVALWVPTTQLTATATITQPVCPAGTGSIDITASGGVGTVLYSLDGGLPQAGSTFTGVAPGMHYVTVTDAGGCTVTINSLFLIDPMSLNTSATAESCAGASDGTITVFASVTGTCPYTYDWGTGQHVTGAVPPCNNYTITGLAGGSYTVTVTDANGCTGQQTVNVPASSINITQIVTQDDYCMNGLGKVTFSVVVPQNPSFVPYTVTLCDQFNVPLQSQTVTTLPWFNPFQHGFTGIVGGNYFLKVTHGPSGCTYSVPITIVNHAIIAATFTVVDEICGQGNGSITIHQQPLGIPISYKVYDAFNALVINGSFTTNPFVIPYGFSAGTYTVDLSFSQPGISCQETYTVMVGNSDATANFSWPATVCANDPIAFTDLSTPSNGGTITSWAWTFAGPAGSSTLQNPSHTFTVAGTHAISLTVTDDNGCTNTVTQNVTVNQPPTALFSATAPNGCIGTTVTFTDLSTAGGAPIVAWDWDFGDGTPHDFTQNPTHQYLIGGPITGCLTVTDANGCTAQYCQTGTLTAPPTAAYSATPTTICQGESVTFTDLSTAGGGAITGWDWDFGDGTPHDFTQNPTHQFNLVGTHTVTLVVTDANGCDDQISTLQIVVNQPPTALFSATAPNGCIGTTVTFTDQSTAGGAPIVAWDWDFGDGSPHDFTQNPTHQYLVAGPVTGCLTVTDANGCTATYCQTGSFFTLPTAAYSATPTVTCIGETVTFTDNSTAGAGAITNWDWDFGDGSPHDFTQNPTHQYLIAGTYTVTLIVADANGCDDLINTLQITIHDKPVAAFTPSSLQVCDGDQVTFTDNSTVGLGCSITNWDWTFTSPAGTSTLQNPSHTFSGAGVGNATLQITDNHGCTNTQTQSIIINALPSASFTMAPNPVCTNTQVAFTDQSTPGGGAITGWSWNLGISTSTLQNPTETYTVGNTSHTITLDVTDANGCTANAQQTLTIHPEPVAAFASSTNCLGEITSFTDLSTSPSGIASWSWSFPSPAATSTLQNPTHTFNASGAHMVTLTVTDNNGCTNTVTQQVNVDPLPVANFSWANVCAGDFTQFTDLSIPNAASIIDWEWTFPNGTSSLQNPSHVLPGPGTWAVILKVMNSNGCEHTVTLNVTVHPLPVPAFTHNAPNCFDPALPTQFTDQSTSAAGISSWYWTFTSPAANSTLQNPSHLYNAPGSHLVTLVVTDGNGCQNTIQQTITIHPNPVAAFSNTTVCLGDPVQFTDLSTTATGFINSWDWTWPNQLVHGTVQNPTHTFTFPGLQSVTLTVTNNHGCTGTVTQQVNVEEVQLCPIPDVTICVDECVVLGCPDDPCLQYEWTHLQQVVIWVGGAWLDTWVVVTDGFDSELCVSPDETTTYTLLVKDICTGCTTEREVTVTVDENCHAEPGLGCCGGGGNGGGNNANGGNKGNGGEENGGEKGKGKTAIATSDPTRSLVDELNVKLQLVPNPARTRVTVRFNTTDIGAAAVTITDLQGRVVAVQQIQSWQGSAELAVDALSSGTYLVRLRSGNKLLGVERLVITD